MAKLNGRAADPDETSGLRHLIDNIHRELGILSPPVHQQWSPDVLRALHSRELPGAQVIVVSNREPYIHNWEQGRLMLQKPASGLVSALEPVMRVCGGTWIAHGHGSADADTVDGNDRILVPPDAPAYKLRRIWLSEDEQEGYYYGFANEGLWPLCHMAFVRPHFRESDWQAYAAVNQRFADAVVAEARQDDPIVLVQDYHLALVPGMVRTALPKATIVTFWHIPWPNAECFGICPWREHLLRGLLSSSIVGFHTRAHCINFLDAADRYLECRIDHEESSVTVGGAEALVRPYPISIAWPPVVATSWNSIEGSRAQLRGKLGLAPDALIGVGVDRLDYTKGIVERIAAVGALLQRRPELIGRFAFVQAAAPTRSRLPSYARLQDEARAAATAVNDAFAAGSYRPVHLLERHHDAGEVTDLYRGCDVCVVTSLHDGMNLVAKEFVAARDDERGVLLLSSFAGAARELSDALIVNPYDEAAMAEALHRALLLPEAEQESRMRQMRAQVEDHNVYRWAGRMLLDASAVRRQAQRQNSNDAAGARPAT